MNDYYPRETTEFIPVSVTVNGAAVTSGVEFCVTSPEARPSLWAAPVVLEGKIGVMTALQSPGDYVVWAKVTDLPEIPVIKCGQYRVT